MFDLRVGTTTVANGVGNAGSGNASINVCNWLVVYSGDAVKLPRAFDRPTLDVTLRRVIL